jgi:dolichol-phosphate mannosyltransferase
VERFGRLFARLLSPRVLRFAAVGFSGVFVNLGAFHLLFGVLDVRQVISTPIAIEVSILWNFVLNDAWTFRDKNENAAARYGQRMVRYNVASLVGLGIQFATSMFVTKTAVRLTLPHPDVWPYVGQLVGIGFGMVSNFLGNFFWTWAQEKPQPEGS